MNALYHIFVGSSLIALHVVLRWSFHPAAITIERRQILRYDFVIAADRSNM
jgi:hypothetical protein